MSEATNKTETFVPKPRVAYFSMEIAMESDIPTYSGGLGVLAGATLRAAADIGVPMVAVTLVSRAGYFRQAIDKFPFQIVMAGKAHPNDTAGKQLIETLHAHMRELAGDIPMTFLPDYDLALALHMGPALTSGSTPRCAPWKPPAPAA